jgi:hypothetical protein
VGLLVKCLPGNSVGVDSETSGTLGGFVMLHAKYGLKAGHNSLKEDATYAITCFHVVKNDGVEVQQPSLEDYNETLDELEGICEENNDDKKWMPAAYPPEKWQKQLAI